VGVDNCEKCIIDELFVFGMSFVYKNLGTMTLHQVTSDYQIGYQVEDFEIDPYVLYQVCNIKYVWGNC
jgi:hypothetical protein